MASARPPTASSPGVPNGASPPSECTTTAVTPGSSVPAGTTALSSSAQVCTVASAHTSVVPYRLRITAFGWCARSARTSSPRSGSPLRCHCRTGARSRVRSRSSLSISPSSVGTSVTRLTWWSATVDTSSSGEPAGSGRMTVGAPRTSPSNSSATASTNPTGVRSRNTSSGSSGSADSDQASRFTIAEWARTTPFGSPVLPDVNTGSGISSTSRRAVSSGSRAACPAPVSTTRAPPAARIRATRSAGCRGSIGRYAAPVRSTPRTAAT